MTGRRLALTVFAAAAMVGAVAGLLTARPADATTAASLAVHPGAATYLNCGWHGECLTPTSGVALDWRKTGDKSIYWRSWAYAIPEGSYAKGVIVNRSATCTETDVDISSPVDYTYRGSEMYVHAATEISGVAFVLTGTTWGTWFARYIGYTVGSEGNGQCPWTAEHLHQRAYWENVSSQSRNTSLYPSAINSGTYSDITSQGKQQDYATWTY